MELNYDEDLNENSFFQMLQNDHSEIFETATQEGWIICVPRSGSLPKYALTPDDFLSHILIPSDELPESHYHTLNDKEVRVCNRLVTVEQSDITRPYSTHVLFEETFYTVDMLKYKVLCVETPLERRSDLVSCNVNDTGIVTVQTLRDCIDLLWTESSSKEVLEKMDETIKSFLCSSINLELETIQVQKDQVGGLYTQCLQIALKDTRLREKTSLNKHLLENVKLAVETYMHHAIYKNLVKGISACTAHEDSCMNKIVRNLCDLQLRDLSIRLDLYETVPRARQELARIDCYSTVLGKIGCLKRMVGSVSKQSVGPASEMGNAIAADDLLPVIIFLIIKTGVPNWIAHLTYMKHFRFAATSTCEVDESSFLITTLEAAIEHVRSGILLGHSDPESQFTYEDAEVESETDFMELKQLPKEEASSCIAYFFEMVRLDNVEEVQRILDKNLVSEGALNFSSRPKCALNILPSLCHPLCSCDKCESLISKSLCDTTPTIHSCNDRGFTALHVASLFGRPQLVDLLISRGANINASDYSGSTPLHYASAKGHQNALLLLLHAGARVDILDNDGNTPLHFASNNGHDGCVKALLYFVEHLGARLDLDVVNTQGDTALHHAARWGYEGIVQILTEYGASVNIQNKRLKTPIDYSHNLHILRLLNKGFNSVDLHAFDKARKISSHSDDTSSRPSLDFDEAVQVPSPNSFNSGKDERGVRPRSTEQIQIIERLLRAIALGDTRLACFYLGFDSPNLASVSHSSDCPSLCHPLCICEKCKPKTSNNDDELTEQQPPENDQDKLNCNACNSDGFTSLHIAAMHGRSEIVRLLLDAGARINVMTRSSQLTPLHLACQNQRTQVAKLLLQSANCDLNLQDARGNTALHYSCYTGNSRLVEIILKHGPRLDISNADGKTPLQEAEEKTSLTVLKLLKGGKPMDLGLSLQ